MGDHGRQTQVTALPASLSALTATVTSPPSPPHPAAVAEQEKDFFSWVQLIFTTYTRPAQKLCIMSYEGIISLTGVALDWVTRTSPHTHSMWDTMISCPRNSAPHEMAPSRFPSHNWELSSVFKSAW